MKTSLQQNRSIQQNLNDPDFIKMLQEHPVVQGKVKRTKKNLGLVTADQNLSSSK